MVCARTYQVLDGALRTRAAVRENLPHLRCLLVYDITQVVEPMRQAQRNTDAQPLKASEMAWRIDLLYGFDRPAADLRRSDAIRAGIRRGGRRITTGAGVLRPAVANAFDTSEQVIQRLRRIWLARLDPDLAKQATACLKRLDEGESINSVYIDLYPPHHNTRNAFRTTANTMGNDLPEVTDPGQQAKAYANSIQQLNGIVAALLPLRNPSDELTVEELTTFAHGFASARSEIARLTRALNNKINDKQEDI